MSFYEKNLRKIYDLASVSYGALARFFAPIIVFPPMRYTVYVTTTCNFSCSYCHVIDGLNQKQNRLTIEEWKKISKKILPFSVVSISGGEPLTARETLPFIKLLRERKIFVTMVTNGSLLNESKLQEIEESQLNYLMISLDGYGETHDRSRGHKGSFDKIEKALRLIDEKFSIKVGIKAVISNENYRELIDLIKFCENFKCIKDIQFALIFDNPLNGGLNTFNNLNDKRLFQGNAFTYNDREGLIKSLKEVNAYKTLSKKEISFTFEGQKVGDIYSYIKSPRSYGVKNCMIPWTDLSIHANGDLTPCLSLNLGNIRDFDYRPYRVLKDVRMKKFRRFMRKNKFLPACEGCTIVPKHNPKSVEE